MIEKVVRKHKRSEYDEIQDNLKYWLSKSPDERVSAVEILRRQHYGEMGPIDKSIWRVMNRESGEVIKQSPAADRYFSEHPEESGIE